jgi:hypothetical protein
MMRSTRYCRLALLGLILQAVAPAWAEVGLSLGGVQGQGWQAEAISLQLVDGDEPGRYQLALDAGRLLLPGALGEWSGLQLRCPALQLDGEAYRCPELQLQADTPQGHQQLTGSLQFGDVEHWSLRLDGVRLAGGSWRLQVDADGRWQAVLEARGASATGLLALWPGGGIPAWDWQGNLDGRVEVHGRGEAPDRVDAALKLARGAWSSPDGLQAAETLAGGLTLKARHQSGAWRGRLSTDWATGQIYSDPMYLELGKHPLQLGADVLWRDGQDALALDGLALRLGKLLTVEGQARLPLATPAAADARLRVGVPDLAAAYPVLLQPLAYGGALGALQLVGKAGLSLTVQQGVPSAAALTLSEVHLDDDHGRFGISGLDGSLYWQAAGEPQPSLLRWQGGHLYRVDFAASRADLALLGDSVTLTDTLLLPMLDGKLRIPRLKASGLRGDRPTWQTALRAETLSLPTLSAALGWPALAGDLSVEIPDVHYADGVLALDGELLASAFGGEVRVSGLQLRDPLSPAPLFQAEASLRDLDLERLTRVFDFGRITGRLEGEVRGLQLVGWQPVAFQAVLQSPAQDDLPHRISQRAVENLTALGNNGAVALSGTFLRFFESFSYDRLMLRVDLAGQRAQLDGIAHPDGGYYLVKGAGLPRIDVIGRNRDVAWRDLVERLRRIQLKGAQVR